MDVIELLKGRRSIRHYLDRQVDEEVLAEILEAVRWAPSGGNTQPWEVVVVRDADRKKELAATLGPGNPARKAVAQAPVLLVLCGRVKIPDSYHREATTKFGDWWFMLHLGIAAQNLCLAAHRRELGTVMVGFFDHDRARGLLQVPEGFEVVLLIPVGYPARLPEPPGRRPVSDFVHHEVFGGKPDPGAA